MSENAGGPPARGGVQTATNEPRRIGELDALRGFALVGITFMNIVQMTGLRWPSGPPADHPDPTGFLLLFDNRFMPMFAFLFGMSFALFLRSAHERTDRPRLVFLRRLVVLGLIGIPHGFLQEGEVLRIYAVCGILFLLPASYLSRRAQLVLGAVLTVTPLTLSGVVPFFAAPAFFTPPGLFLLGAAALHYGVVDNLAHRTGRLIAVAAVLLVAAVPLCWWQLQVDVDMMARRAQVAGVVVAALFAVLFLLLLCTPFAFALYAVFAPLGRMALTNYLMATLLILLGTTVFGFGSGVASTGRLGLAIGVVQAVLSMLWLRWFRYGPVEWAWRCLTWWELVDLRRAARHDAVLR